MRKTLPKSSIVIDKHFLNAVYSPYQLAGGSWSISEPIKTASKAGRNLCLGLRVKSQPCKMIFKPLYINPLSKLLKDSNMNQPSKISYEPSNYTHDETVVSEFVVAKFKPPPLSSAPSSSASTTAGGGFGGDSPFDVPQTPKLDGNEKEKVCPSALTAISCCQPGRSRHIKRRSDRSGISLKTCSHMPVSLQTALLQGRRIRLSGPGNHTSANLTTTVGSALFTQKTTTAMPQMTSR